jgi:hypothetical protein
MVWIVLDTDYPGPPPKMVFRGGTENCRDWITKRRNREPDKVKLPRFRGVVRDLVISVQQ